MADEYGIVRILPQIVSTAGAVAGNADIDTFQDADQTSVTRLMTKLPSYAGRGAAWYVSPEANDLVF